MENENKINNEIKQEFKSFFKLTPAQYESDPYSVKMTVTASKEISKFGTKYKLYLNFPRDYVIPLGDSVAVTRNGERVVLKPFERFSQDDFYLIALSKNVGESYNSITLNAYARLVKGASTSADDPDSFFEWFKLEIMSDLKNGQKICKSLFISSKVAYIISHLNPKFAKPYVVDGHQPVDIEGEVEDSLETVESA